MGHGSLMVEETVPLKVAACMNMINGLRVVKDSSNCYKGPGERRETREMDMEEKVAIIEKHSQ